jgi:hypothetical protein
MLWVPSHDCTRLLSKCHWISIKGSEKAMRVWWATSQKTYLAKWWRALSGIEATTVPSRCVSMQRDPTT